jgi:hypothetical protein
MGMLLNQLAGNHLRVSDVSKKVKGCGKVPGGHGATE